MTFTTLLRTWSLLSLAVAAIGFGASCAESQPRTQRVRIIKPEEEAQPTLGGIPPDKAADIQLVLQQRDTLTRKCYQDVLNEKHDRAFKGSVVVLLTVEPNGKASDVQVIGGTLNNDEVSQCLVETIKQFEFPPVDAKGSVQYSYLFQPAY